MPGGRTYPEGRGAGKSRSQQFRSRAASLLDSDSDSMAERHRPRPVPPPGRVNLFRTGRAPQRPPLCPGLGGGISHVEDGPEVPELPRADRIDLFGFLTTEPSEPVASIHPKAMPAIITEPEEVVDGIQIYRHWISEEAGV